MHIDLLSHYSNIETKTKLKGMLDLRHCHIVNEIGLFDMVKAKV